MRLLTAIRAYLQSEVTPETLVDTFYTEAAKRLATLMEEAHATIWGPSALLSPATRRRRLCVRRQQNRCSSSSSGPTDAVGSHAS